MPGSLKELKSDWDCGGGGGGGGCVILTTCGGSITVGFTSIAICCGGSTAGTFCGANRIPDVVKLRLSGVLGPVRSINDRLSCCVNGGLVAVPIWATPVRISFENMTSYQ